MVPAEGLVGTRRDSWARSSLQQEDFLPCFGESLSRDDSRGTTADNNVIICVVLEGRSRSRGPNNRENSGDAACLKEPHCEIASRYRSQLYENRQKFKGWFSFIASPGLTFRD